MINQPAIQRILQQYQALLSTVDDWFDRCKSIKGDQIHCVSGCSACCRGLFDITLLDACLLQTGFARLPEARRTSVLLKAEERLLQLQSEWPDLQHPYLLNHLPDELWTEMPEGDETPCPLLDKNGRCLVYAYRPMICRTHGLPNIDVSGESFSDLCCTLNFPNTDPLLTTDLHWSFRHTFEQELLLFETFTRQLLGKSLREVDTFIPLALLIDFDLLCPKP